MKRRSNWGWIAGTGLLVGLLALAGLATAAFAQGPTAPWQGWGPGSMMRGLGRMMGGWSHGGWGGMMGGVMGGGMPGLSPVEGMGGYGMMGSGSCHGGWGNPDAGTPLTIDEAAERAETYVASLGNPDLVLTEVMEFTNNFYAEVEEESTGIHAFELLIDRYTGAVHPEPGPNMMWNTKYGHMGGMMGGWWGTPGGEMTVTPEQARAYAQTWLDANASAGPSTGLPGTTVADEVDTFYGYYTIHTLRDGEITGMLSVNGYTGAVWYHTWHGDFLGMQEFEH